MSGTRVSKNGILALVPRNGTMPNKKVISRGKATANLRLLAVWVARILLTGAKNVDFGISMLILSVLWYEVVIQTEADEQCAPR